MKDNMNDKTRVLAIILDGFGHSEQFEGNAIAQAKKPYIEKIWKENPTILINASGNYSGLPDGEMGTSESGHVTIGAGDIIWQPLEEINQSIITGDFFDKQLLINAMDKNKPLHLIGMLSDGGVHSHIDHLKALLKIAKKKGLSKVFIHCIADGRDVEMASIRKYLTELSETISALGVGEISDLIGRFYAMDRDSNIDRTQAAFNLFTKGEGFIVDDLESSIEYAYKEEKNDYYIKPIKFNDTSNINKSDNIVFFNFRADRASQLTKMFFDNGYENLLAFGPYTDDYPVLFPPQKVENNLSNILSKKGLTQLRIAETEKYPHVTFYLNSQNHEKNPGEEHIMIPSPKVPNYADKPEMSAYEVTNTLCDEISKLKHDIIFVNYANADLVGHSGELDAGIKAVETLDKCLSQLIPNATDNGYDILIFADHGNAEKMIDDQGNKCATHTTNPVKLTLISSRNYELKKGSGYGLKDIAPTILNLVGIDKPIEMTGSSLLSK